MTGVCLCGVERGVSRGFLSFVQLVYGSFVFKTFLPSSSFNPCFSSFSSSSYARSFLLALRLFFLVFFFVSLFCFSFCMFSFDSLYCFFSFFLFVLVSSFVFLFFPRLTSHFLPCFTPFFPSFLYPPITFSSLIPISVSSFVFSCF